ncbi:hypothetical protein NKG94_31015 [Micromonospora sp. M12]
MAAPASAHPTLTVTASATTVQSGNTVTLTISGKSNGTYNGARIEVFSTGGPGQLTSFTTLAGCGGGTTSCAEITNRYRLGLPNLVNNQNFSYTITVTIDAGTAATTFTRKRSSSPPGTAPPAPSADRHHHHQPSPGRPSRRRPRRSHPGGLPDRLHRGIQQRPRHRPRSPVHHHRRHIRIHPHHHHRQRLHQRNTHQHLHHRIRGHRRLRLHAKRYDVPLLATGSVTFTTTVTPIGAVETNAANNTQTYTCTYLLGISPTAEHTLAPPPTSGRGLLVGSLGAMRHRHHAALGGRRLAASPPLWAEHLVP